MGLVTAIAAAATATAAIVAAAATTADSAAEEPGCPTSSVSCTTGVCVCLFSSDFTYKAQNSEMVVLVVLD